MKRELDGVYFRIKRNEKYENICFSDLTEEEQIEVMEDKSIEWLKSMCIILAEKLKTIGDTFDIVSRIGEEDDE